MYQQFFGLKTPPFALTADLSYLYLTPAHAEALAHLEHGLSGGKGITVLTGEAGTGKSMLITAALNRSERDVLCAIVSNPLLTRAEFYECLAGAFGFSRSAASSKAQFLTELTATVCQRCHNGGMTALLIDEAQCLSFELFEEIRLLANIEADTQKPFQVILVGQPELGERLNEPALRQLKQRVALRCALRALNLNETAAYIAGRIRIAGGEAAQLFTREAVQLVYERSRGIPRVISVLCDNALVTGFALGVRPVNRHIVLDVCRDFDLAPQAGDQPATVPEAEREPEALQQVAAELGATGRASLFGLRG